METDIVMVAVDPGLANTGIAVGKLNVETGGRTLIHFELFHTDPDPDKGAQARFKDHALRATNLLVWMLAKEHVPGTVEDIILVSEWPQGRKDGAVILGIWLGAFPDAKHILAHPRSWQAAMFKGLEGDTKQKSAIRAKIDWGKAAEGVSDHVHDALNMLTWAMDRVYLENQDPQFLDKTRGKIKQMRQVIGARRKQ